MKRSLLREQVFKLLFRLDFVGQEEMSEQEELFFEDRGVTIAPRDRELILRQYHGIREHLEEIDEILEESASGWNLTRVGKVELAVLRLAVYEMKFDETVPVGVAINEAVEIAGKYGQEGAGAFVNAVLSNVNKPQEARKVPLPAVMQRKQASSKENQAVILVKKSGSAGKSDRKEEQTV